jgi:hypothetical protein
MPPARRNTGKDSLAGAAGDRVRAIIEAAESSAAAIRAEAEAEAERIHAQAEERATAVRSEVRGDVQALMGSIRGAIDRLRADLDRLEQRLGADDAEPAPSPASAPAPPPPPADDSGVALAEDAAVEPHEPGGARGTEPDSGARLVALNMALDGAPRAEVDHHLRENLGLSNTGGLLDEVYASIGR